MFSSLLSRTIKASQETSAPATEFIIAKHRSSLTQERGVDTKALKLQLATNEDLCYHTYHLFDFLHFFLLNSKLYPEGGDWDKQAVHAEHSENLPLSIFRQSPLRLC